MFSRVRIGTWILLTIKDDKASQEAIILLVWICSKCC